MIDDLLEGQNAIVQFKCSTFQQDDAILLLLGINCGCIGSFSPSDELLFENVRKKLLHALLISTVFEVHRCHKTLRLRISVRTFQEHPQIVDRADIVFADIDDETRISFLLNGNFSTLLFRSNFNAWLRDLDFLFVEVRCDFDSGVTIYKVDGVCNRILNIFIEVVHFLIVSVLVNDDFGAIFHVVDSLCLD